VHKLTLAPGAVAPADIDALRAQGFDDLDILDAKQPVRTPDYTNRVATAWACSRRPFVEERTPDRIPS